MARRSARLQTRSVTPAEEASAITNDDSWMTAASSPDQRLPTLPELPDLPAPGAKTPQKATTSRRQNATKLQQTAATPLKTKSSIQLLEAMTSRTPTNRTPIKPAIQDMHPALHHASTAKPLDEARWLGFQNLGSHTAPSKAAHANPGTPSKTPAPSTNNKRFDSSPDFRFQFKSPFASFSRPKKELDLGLSPRLQNIVDNGNVDSTPAGSRAIFGATEFSSKQDVSPQRKKVEAKGKMARFSDVHMAQFKKMDSIANHVSAFRADPSRFKPVAASTTKKSPSKPDLVKPESSKLKRTQSKMDMTEAQPAVAHNSLKRTQSKVDVGASSSRIPPSPLKRTQSRLDLAGSSLPRSQSTVRLVEPGTGERPVSRHGPIEGNTAAKRVKRTESDDAATTRPVSRDSKLPTPTAPTPARKITSQTALSRLASRLMTPTKASVARTQSAKTTKTSSMIPSMMKSPSTNNIFSPTHIAQSMRDGARESMQKASQNLQRVRSILRTPNCKFSDDPQQVAAGTHMSPPSMSNFEKSMPAVPATAPVKKHVNFSNSTLQRAGEDTVGKSPSPMKFRAGSEVPSGAIFYPTLQAVRYPELGQESERTPEASPARRLTFGGETAHHPRTFSFESGKAPNFGPASTGTIRMVRKSDASTINEGKKRKLDTVQENSDKENDGPAEDDRSPKKMRPAPSTPSKTPASASKLPRRTPARGSAISTSRLAFLATPKRAKA